MKIVEVEGFPVKPNKTIEVSQFANNLRILRKSKGYKQEDMAYALGIKRATLGSYEEGRCEPRFQTLITISNYFEVSIDDLLKAEIKIKK